MPEDPLKLRPFEWTFGAEQIASVQDKLGYIDSKGWVSRGALTHPKVRSGAALPEEGADGEVHAASTSKDAYSIMQIEKHQENLNACRCVAYHVSQPT